ncbi:MAG: YncE family protein [Candidatus Binatia bacterium]
MKNKILSFAVLLGIFGLVGASFGQSGSGYHLVDEIKVGGEGGWDGLVADAEGRRLYVSHATRVIVIDTQTDKVVGEIPNTNGIHCIALAEKLGRGFTSNGRDNSVTIFDLKTLKVLGTVPTGKNPDAISYDPASKRVFAFNGGSSDVTVIDAAEGKVVGTIPLNGKPEFSTVDGAGTVFVNLEDKSEVLAIDAAKMTVRSRWPLAPGEEPTGLALDPKTMRLFSACKKRMVILDAASGKVLSDLPTGQGTDGAEFDPHNRFAFASNGEGTLTVVREESKDKFSVVENVPTRRGARTMAIDTKTHKVYLPTAKFGETPAPTAQQPRPRAPIIPDSFVVLVYAK